MSRLVFTLLCVSLLSAIPIQAQVVDALGRPRVETVRPAQNQTQTETETAIPPDPAAIDPTKLGVSFDRVRMQLSQAPPSKSHGLKIQESIEVVGKAPVQYLWNPKTVDLTSAAVPFGAPTQKDIMKLIVPKEFQTYPFDLNALMQWLMEHLNKKTE